MSQFTSESELPKPKRRRRVRRWFVRIAIAMLVLLIVAELFARFYLGLGDPPLSISDPDIEYLFAPSQDVRRFGNHIHYNAYSMRSDDFPQHKTDPRELRVLVLGDSVINGGALTDQANTATEILKRELSAKLNRPVVVGNVSAASWGPPNLWAYVKHFGNFFDADVIVFVYSSHDYADAPTFERVVGINPNFPDHRPWFAVEELWSRYLWPRIAGAAVPAEVTPSEAPPKQSDIDQSMFAVRELLVRAKATGAAVIVAQHLEAKEQNGTVLPGHDRIMNVARDEGVPVVQFGPAEHAALAAGKNPYRDNIHPNEIGQQIMADALLEPIEQALKSRVPPSTMPVDSHRVGG